MCREKTDWEKAVEFHGHICMGLVYGYRAARAALRVLDSKRAPDEELVAVVETDACGVDALQVLTGCTLGKGNLIFRDYGKHVFTVGQRRTGRAVRVVVKQPEWTRNAELQLLREKVLAGSASQEEKEEWQKRNQEMIERLLEAPEEEVCAVQELDCFKFPEKARIFNSVICAVCGERVAEARARVKNGRFVCIPCSEDYSRGW